MNAIMVNYLTINDCWVVTYGDNLISIGDRYLFSTFDELVQALNLVDLGVEDNHIVIVR